MEHNDQSTRPKRRAAPSRAATLPKAAPMGAYIAELRTAAGLKQPQLAEITGIPSLRISLIENDRVHPRVGEVVALAKALNASLDRLVFGKARREERLLRLLEGLTREERAVVERMLCGLITVRDPQEQSPARSRRAEQ